jgi:hypothetical protein
MQPRSAAAVFGRAVFVAALIMMAAAAAHAVCSADRQVPVVAGQEVLVEDPWQAAARAELAAASQEPSSRPDLSALAADLPQMFPLDQQGRIEVGPDLQAVLDALSSRLLAEALPGDLDWLLQELDSALGAGTGQQAAQLLRRYYGYRREADSLSRQPRLDSLAAMQQHLQDTIALRRRHFDRKTADLLFGLEEARSLYGIRAMQIEVDESLSGAEKAARIEALQQSLPSEVARAVRNEPRIEVQ